MTMITFYKSKIAWIMTIAWLLIFIYVQWGCKGGCGNPMLNDYLIGPGFILTLLFLILLNTFGIKFGFLQPITGFSSEIIYIYIAMVFSFVLIYIIGYIIEVFVRKLFFNKTPKI